MKNGPLGRLAWVKKAKGTTLPVSRLGRLSQSFPGKAGKNKARSVDVLVVVFAQFLLLRGIPGSQRLLEVALWVLAADHETDLA
jgi:hypothetical protein